LVTLAPGVTAIKTFLFHRR